MQISTLFKISFFICLAAIEFLATTSRKIPIVEQMWDKSNHLIAFSTLYILLNFGWQGLKFDKKFCILLAFGIQIEIAQALLPNRYFSLLDIVADCVGILLGFGVVKILNKSKVAKFLRQKG